MIVRAHPLLQSRPVGGRLGGVHVLPSLAPVGTSPNRSCDVVFHARPLLGGRL